MQAALGIHLGQLISACESRVLSFDQWRHRFQRSAAVNRFDARRPKPARSIVDMRQTGFVTGATAAGSLVPARPVSTWPAMRLWNAVLPDIVTRRSYQLLLHDRSQ